MRQSFPITTERVSRSLFAICCPVIPSAHNCERSSVVWSPENTELLSQLCAEGITGQQIANKMRLPRSVVVGKLWRMGLKPTHSDLHRPGYKCSPETREKNRISRLGKKHSPETLAKMRGVKRAPAINAKIREQQLSPARAAGLLEGAEDDYQLARRKDFTMMEAIGIANRSLRPALPYSNGTIPVSAILESAKWPS